MRVSRRSFFASLSIAALVLGLLPFSASAQVPHDTAYQGVLKDAVGDPLPGPVDLVLRIFELPSGGSALYTETHTGVVIDPIDGASLLTSQVDLVDVWNLRPSLLLEPHDLGVKVNGSFEIRNCNTELT